MLILSDTEGFYFQINMPIHFLFSSFCKNFNAAQWTMQVLINQIYINVSAYVYVYVWKYAYVC